MRPADSPRDRPPHLPLGRRDFLGRVAAIGLGAGADPGAPAHRCRAGLPRHHTEARARRAPVERPHRARSPRGDLHDRLPRRFQPLRHPRAAPSRRHAPPGPGDRLATHGADHVAPHAAAGRAVARRHPVHRRRRQVQPRPNVRPVREGGPPAAVAPDDRPDRDARPGNARHPHQAAGRAHPGAARRLGPHRPLGVHRPGRVHRRSTSARWEPGPSASCRGPRATDAFSRPTPTTGMDASTWTAWSFAPCPSPAARVDALLHGDADLITQLSPEHGERVASHPSTRVVGAPYAGLYVLAVNVWVAPLNQPARPAGPVAGRRSGRRS